MKIKQKNRNSTHNQSNKEVSLSLLYQMQFLHYLEKLINNNKVRNRLRNNINLSIQSLFRSTNQNFHPGIQCDQSNRLKNLILILIKYQSIHRNLKDLLKSQKNQYTKTKTSLILINNLLTKKIKKQRLKKQMWKKHPDQAIKLIKGQIRCKIILILQLQILQINYLL